MTTQTLPVLLDVATHKRLSNYAEVVGKPLQQVVSKALNRWMDEFGEDILEAYAQLADRQKKSRKRAQKEPKEVLVFSRPEPVEFVLPQAAEAGIR